jgi:hypothetical protein
MCHSKKADLLSVFWESLETQKDPTYTPLYELLKHQRASEKRGGVPWYQNTDVMVSPPVDPRADSSQRHNP